MQPAFDLPVVLRATTMNVTDGLAAKTSINLIEVPLDIFEVVEVAIKSSRGGELGFLQICSRVTFPIARSSLLMLLVARQRTCLCLASWALVFWFLDIAKQASVTDSGLSRVQVAICNGNDT